MQNELRAKGFSGFITFQELIKDSTLIPSQKGVYIVLRENMEKPAQLQISVAYFCSIGLYFLV